MNTTFEDKYINMNIPGGVLASRYTEDALFAVIDPEDALKEVLIKLEFSPYKALKNYIDEKKENLFPVRSKVYDKPGISFNHTLSDEDLYKDICRKNNREAIIDSLIMNEVLIPEHYIVISDTIVFEDNTIQAAYMTKDDVLEMFGSFDDYAIQEAKSFLENAIDEALYSTASLDDLIFGASQKAAQQETTSRQDYDLEI